MLSAVLWLYLQHASVLSLAAPSRCKSPVCEAPDSASQQWDVMADGRIALAASKPQECLDLQYMRATPNNPVGLYSCAGLNNAGAGDAGLNWPLVNATG